MANDNDNSNVDNDPGSVSPETPTRRPGARRKWILLGLTAVFVLAGGLYAAYYFAIAQYYAKTDDAYVAGNRIQLTAQVNGTVTAVAANNTDFVQDGDRAVQLDPTDAHNALQHAKAELADTLRSVRQLYAQVDEQKSIIAQRESVNAQAKRDYERGQKLLKSHGISQKVFEHTRSDYHEARAALASARHKLEELHALTDNTTLHDHPRVKAAEAKVRSAWLDLQRTHILAPVSGHVAQREVEVGKRIAPGKPLLTIVPLDQIWVDANFKETDMAAMRIGQPVTLVADFYGSQVTYHGHVAGLSAGTGAAFSLLPPQNATGNWIKVVRRVPVRIVLDDAHHELEQYPLRLGLSMSVEVDLHDTDGPRLANSPPEQPRHRTQVYQQRLAGAQQLIERIVAANDGPVRVSEAKP